MINVKTLLAGEGVHFASKPRDDLSSLEILAWHCASDLADFVEISIEPEDLPRTFPQTWTVLFGLQSYFAEIDQPLSQSHALVLLLADRAINGLTPRGDETQR